MNATLAEDGALSLFIMPNEDLNKLFLTVALSFSTDGSDNFDTNFINKTIDFGKLLSFANYFKNFDLLNFLISE